MGEEWVWLQHFGPMLGKRIVEYCGVEIEEGFIVGHFRLEDGEIITFYHRPASEEELENDCEMEIYGITIERLFEKYYKGNVIRELKEGTGYVGSKKREYVIVKVERAKKRMLKIPC